MNTRLPVLSESTIQPTLTLNPMNKRTQTTGFLKSSKNLFLILVLMMLGSQWSFGQTFVGTTVQATGGLVISPQLVSNAVPQLTSSQVNVTVNPTQILVNFVNANIPAATEIRLEFEGGDFVGFTSAYSNGGPPSITPSADGDDIVIAFSQELVNVTDMLIINFVSPGTVSSVTLPADKTYIVGENLDFIVNYSNDVDVTGFPTLALTVGGDAKTATYESKTSSALTFRYTVQPGDFDDNGIELGSIISLNGGSIKMADQNEAEDLTLNNVGDLENVKVDGRSNITDATYNSEGGVLTVTGNFNSGETIAVNKLTISGRTESVELTTSDVSTSSATQFTVNLNATDKNAVNMKIVNKDGLLGTDDTPYYLSAASDWATSGAADANNEITASNVGETEIDAVTYNTLTGVLVATGTAFKATPGPLNDVVVNQFRIDFGGDVQSSDQIELTSATSFTYTLTGADKDMANAFVDKAGLDRLNGDPYSFYAAIPWMPSMRPNSGASEDTPMNVTIPIPTISSVAYDYSTNELLVTGTNFYSKDGVANDIDLAKLTIKGQGADDSAYTLTGTDVEITSATSFKIELSGADLTEVEKLINKNGTESIDNTDYNLAFAEDWNNGIGETVDIESLTHAITASNVVLPASVVSSVTVPDDNTYTASQVLSFTVKFDEAVNVDITGGVPSLPLTIGADSKSALYDSGTGTDELIFNYTVQIDDLDDDGIQIGTAIALNSGTIKNKLDGTTNATLTLNNKGVTTGVSVDAVVPTVSDVSIISDNDNPTKAKPGDKVTLTFTASEAMNTLFVEVAGHDISGDAAIVTDNDWKVEYIMTAGDPEGDVAIKIGGSDIAGNAMSLVTTINTGNVVYDETAPTTTIASRAFSADTGVPSDFITKTTSQTISGTLSANLLAGETVQVSVDNGNSYTAATIAVGQSTWTVDITLPGNSFLKVVVQDDAGNKGTEDVTEYIIDQQVPTLSAVSIASDNSTTTLAKTGNKVTVLFTSSEAVQTPIATIATKTATVTNVSGNNWKAEYTFTGTGEAEGVVAFTLDFTDLAGNSGTQVTSGTGSVTYDKTAPTLSAVSIASDNSTTTLAKTGNKVTVLFTSSEGAQTPTATIATKTATVSNVSGNNWKAEYTFTGTGEAEGTVAFAINFSDLAGNAGTQVTTGTGSVSYDKTLPTLSAVSIASDNSTTTLAKTGNKVTVLFTSSESVQTPTATIATKTATVTNVTGNEWKAEYTFTGTGEAEGTVAYAINFSDLTGNAGTAVTTGSGSVIYDKSSPTLSAVSIASDNSNTAYAKTGHKVTVVFTSSEAVQTPTATIATKTATVTNVSGNNWKAEYTFTGTGEAEGVVAFTLDFTDLAGNSGTQVTSGTGSVTYDKTAPTLSAVSIASDNSTTTLAKTGNKVTVLFTSSEGAQTPTATIATKTATVSNVSGNNWKAEYTFTGTGEAEGTVAFAINFSDLAGNAGTAVTTGTGSVSYDKTLPTLSAVSIASDNSTTTLAKTGNKVTVLFTSSESVQTPTATIATKTATVTNVTGNEWKAEYTFTGTGEAEGTVAYAINFSDLAGNAGIAVTTGSGSVIYDKSAPSFSAVTIASNNSNAAYAKIGNVVTLSFTSSENISAPTVSMAGHAVTPSHTGNDWTATYTMLTGDPVGAVAFSISSFNDDAGNGGTTRTTTTNSGSVTFDETAPTLTAVSITSNNANTALAKPGNTITLNFTANEGIQTPVVLIAGHSATVTDLTSNNWIASYTLAGTEDDGDAEFSITYKDLASNAGAAPATATTNSSSVEINNSVPQLSTVTIVSDNSSTNKAKTGNKVTINFTANKEITTPIVTIATKTATVTNVTGNEWKAEYTFTGTGEAEGPVAFNIAFQDLASNAGIDVTATTNSSTVSYDKTVPTLSDVHIESDGSIDDDRVKVGEEVELVFTSSETITTPTVTIAGHTALVESEGGNNWIAFYNMASGDSETSSVPFSITFADPSGNAGTTVTAVTDASAVLFDKTAPTLSSVQSVTADGTKKLGATISLSVIFSENVTVDGTPTLALNSGGTASYSGGTGTSTLTFSYTVAAGNSSGDLDYNSTTALSLNEGSVIDRVGNDAVLTLATPGAANSLGANSALVIDGIIPTLTTVTISSDNTNTSFAQTGDEVTLQFTAAEAISAPTISIMGHSVTPMNTSGNQWKAAYTLVGGDSEGVVTFNIAFSDNAANAGIAVTSTTNSSSVTYDTSIPTISDVHIESDGSIDDDRVKVGEEVEIVFTASETLATPTVTISGQPAVLTDEGGNQWLATYTMQASDAETLSVPFTIDFADPSGNAGVTVTAVSDGSAVEFNKTSPTVSSVQSITADGTKTPGETISISVTFSEDVFVTDTPKIALNSGGTASYSSGSESNTLVFTYTVGAADATADLDYSSIDALSLDGGLITDNVGNDAVLTLAAPGGVNSLGGNSYIIIDGDIPTLTAVTYSVEGSSTDIIAKTGKEIILQFTASEVIAVPTVSILGHIVTATNPLDNHWKATYTITDADAEGPVTFSITYSDLAANAGATANATTNNKVISINRSNADLSALVLSAGTLNPVFSSGATTYNVSVGNTVTSITVKPNLADLTAASLKVNDVTIASGVASNAIPLTAALTPITIEVIAQNGTTKKIYTINVNRSLLSDNANLRAIKSPDYTLSPDYNASLTRYTATVANSVTSATITPTAEDAKATITVNQVAVAAGSSPTVQLNTGINIISVIATAEDGVTTKTYTITITREAPVLSNTQTTPDAQGNVNPTAEKPNVVVTSNTQPLTVNLPSNSTTEPVKVDFSLFLTTVLNIIQVQVPEFKVVPSSPTGVSLAIPQTRIESSNPNWSGVILAPTVTTYTIPAKPGVIAKEGLVIEVGDPNFGLSLDKAARLVFPGQKGKAAAFVHNGKYIEITKVGLTDTQAEGDALGKDEAYRIDVGNDMIVWTKAFSKFLTFEESVDLNVAVVASDLALLTADGIKGANIDLNNITAKLDALPSTMTGGSTVTWSSSDPALLSSDGQTINRPASGTATVTLTATVRKGAVTQTKTFTLTLLSGNQAPTLAAIANQALCYTTTVQTIGLTGITPGPDAGQTTTLSLSSSNPGLFSSLTVTGTGSTGTISYVTGNTAGGTATITVTVRDNGGTGNGGVDTFTRTFTITVNPAPVITITSNLGTSISKGLTAVLSATGGTTYAWANASGIVSGQNSPILTVRPTANTTYTVTVTNATGCVSTQSFNLIVNEDYQALDINNLMSPNGDGKNDKLVIKNLDMYPNNTVKIFDRSGRLLYQKVNYTNDWDGTFQGTPLTNDTYFYVVDFGAGRKQIRGFVSIINQ